MPYIDQKERTKVQPAKTPGQLTYDFQQGILKYLEYTGLRYAHIAEVLGSLEGAKLDFIERVVKPYEDKKRVENGDVWPLTMTGAMGDDDLMEARFHAPAIEVEEAEGRR